MNQYVVHKNRSRRTRRRRRRRRVSTLQTTPPDKTHPHGQHQRGAAARPVLFRPRSLNTARCIGAWFGSVCHTQRRRVVTLPGSRSTERDDRINKMAEKEDYRVSRKTTTTTTQIAPYFRQRCNIYDIITNKLFDKCIEIVVIRRRDTAHLKCTFLVYFVVSPNISGLVTVIC